MIRDESQNVARKARARLEWEKGAREKREDSGATSSSHEPSSLDILNSSECGTEATSDVSIDALLPYATFPISVDDQGFCFLFSRYVVVDSTLPNGRPDYVSTKTWRNASLSEVMRDAMISVGLAALSNVRNNTEMLVMARKKLSSVLHQTMMALQDPREARSDAMLRTVMMLWLFEVSGSVTFSKRVLNSHVLDDYLRSSISKAFFGSSPWSGIASGPSRFTKL